MITASAPGKLMLFGEHSVVYGFPCVVTAINKRLGVTVESSDTDAPVFITSKTNNHNFLEAVLRYAQNEWHISPKLKITTASSFSSTYGFGSSSAVTVAALKAITAFNNIHLSERDLFSHSYNIVLNVQTVASGFDVASAVYGGTLLYEKKGKNIAPIEHPPYSLIVTYSGVKADTVELIKEVAKKKELYPERVEKTFIAISQLVVEAKQRLEEGDFERVGKLMEFNQEYLRNLGVSSEKLETLLTAAKVAGAWGSKLSGAGGGDCIITLAPKEKVSLIEQSLRNAGGEIVTVSVDAPGASITTDNPNELFVVVDDTDTIVEYRTRVECHSDPSIIHRAVTTVLHDNKGRILLQKRSKTKDTYPGYWTVSSSGHVGKGEEYEVAAMREMKEEIGVVTPLRFHSKFLVRYPTETEYDSVFTGSLSEKVKLNKNEVETTQLFEPRELKEKVNAKKIVLTPHAVKVLTRLGVLSS